MQLSEYQPFTKRVLVIGRNELHLAGLLNFLYELGYDSIGVLKNEEAFRFFDEHEPHIVIITQHIDADSRAQFNKVFLHINPTLTFLELSGGVSALKLLIENNSNVSE